MLKVVNSKGLAGRGKCRMDECSELGHCVSLLA